LTLTDNRATLKRYKKEDNKVFLEQANPDCPRIEFTPDMDVKLLKVSMVLAKEARKR